MGRRQLDGALACSRSCGQPGQLRHLPQGLALIPAASRTSLRFRPARPDRPRVVTVTVTVTAAVGRVRGTLFSGGSIMKTLVIGATGLLGLEVCRRLRESGVAGASPDSADGGCAEARRAGAARRRARRRRSQGSGLPGARLRRRAVRHFDRIVHAHPPGRRLDRDRRPPRTARAGRCGARGRRRTFRVRVVPRQPADSVSADRRQARGRGGAEERPAWPTPSCRRRTSWKCGSRRRSGSTRRTARCGSTATAASRSAGSPIRMSRAPRRPP